MPAMVLQSVARSFTRSLRRSLLLEASSCGRVSRFCAHVTGSMAAVTSDPQYVSVIKGTPNAADFRIFISV